MKSWIRVATFALFFAGAAVVAEEGNVEPNKSEAVQPATEKAVPMTPATQPDLPAETAPEMARPEPPTYEGAFLKMILVLLLLLFIIFFGIWVIRRLSHSRLRMFKEPKHIRIIDRRPLSAKTALYLIEVGDKRVLVAESQLEVKGLTTVELKE